VGEDKMSLGGCVENNPQTFTSIAPPKHKQSQEKLVFVN